MDDISLVELFDAANGDDFFADGEMDREFTIHLLGQVERLAAAMDWGNEGGYERFNQRAVEIIALWLSVHDYPSRIVEFFASHGIVKNET